MFHSIPPLAALQAAIHQFSELAQTPDGAVFSPVVDLLQAAYNATQYLNLAQSSLIEYGGRRVIARGLKGDQVLDTEPRT